MLDKLECLLLSHMPFKATWDKLAASIKSAATAKKKTVEVAYGPGCPIKETMEQLQRLGFEVKHNQKGKTFLISWDV